MKVLFKNAILVLNCLLASLLFFTGKAYCQTFPSPPVDETLVPTSPNAQAFQVFGNIPVALYEGLPQIQVPIYQIKCGSLTLPISLQYDYSGLYPLQDASWVGLGWNLNAGGAINRTVQDYVDSTQSSGYNYPQYNLPDSVYQENNNNFLGIAYGGLNVAYDMAPDIFDCEFAGQSAKFFLYDGKTYMYNYNKDISLQGSLTNGASVSITTTDGTIYTFGAKETTVAKHYGGSHYWTTTYTSSWFLTSIISANKKDTITLNYTAYSWEQPVASYQSAFAVASGSYNNLGADPVTYQPEPSITTQVLTSILCRNLRVNFVPNSPLRTDVLGSSPSLKEIDVTDSIAGQLVLRDVFAYEYFGQTTGSPAAYQRLMLKNVKIMNPSSTTDSLMYTFSYIDEYSTEAGNGTNIPIKGTNGFDYWGYYNTKDQNSQLIPSPDNFTYNPVLTPAVLANLEAGLSPLPIRTPNFSGASLGALDTVYYPTGGYTAFQYEPNMYYNYTTKSNVEGPGICVKYSVDVDPANVPDSVHIDYTYLQDDGVSSSGYITNYPGYMAPVFSSSSGSQYDLFQASNNSAGTGGYNPVFYYTKVTQSKTSGSETHKSDHYYTSYSTLFLDVVQTKQVDYINNTSNNTYTPVQKTVSTYAYTNDTTFLEAAAYMTGVSTSGTSYYYGYTSQDVPFGWLRETAAQTTQYDTNGDSLVSNYTINYNPTTRNVLSTLSTRSDGQTTEVKYKFPEDYSSAITGTLVSNHVLSKPLEKDTWLKQNSSDSVLIAAEATAYDPVTFNPSAGYQLETTSPTALNNETIASGQYTSFPSDTRFIQRTQYQYDANGNLSTLSHLSDMPTTYIWGYYHSLKVAEVRNASPADIAFTSFEGDGNISWTFSGAPVSDVTAPTGKNSYNLGQTSGNIVKTGLTSTTTYVVSYWLKSTTPLSITGTIAGYPIQGKTINGWTYFEHKITSQTSVTVSGSSYIDELRLYPANAQMVSYTYTAMWQKLTDCDVDNRITTFGYDGFNRLNQVKDQDGNIIKTFQYHYRNEW
jgi:hypothetical protein